MANVIPPSNKAAATPIRADLVMIFSRADLTPPKEQPSGIGCSAACVSRRRSDEARAARDHAAQARGDQAEGRTRHPKKGRGLLRERIDVKFGFVAKHRGIWPAGWLCGALGVSRGGFYGWLTRSRSQRSRNDEEVGAKVRSSFLASDRTYGARRVLTLMAKHRSHRIASDSRGDMVSSRKNAGPCLRQISRTRMHAISHRDRLSLVPR